MYCLDTNIIIDILRGDEKLKDNILSIVSSGLSVYITPITLCELFKGAYLTLNVQLHLRNINDLVNSCDLLVFSKEACQQFGKEFVRLKEIGKIIKESDLMIASIVKVNDLILVTKNKKHFKDIDVKVEKW